MKGFVRNSEISCALYMHQSSSCKNCKSEIIPSWLPPMCEKGMPSSTRRERVEDNEGKW
jgi:hypothetical protein